MVDASFQDVFDWFADRKGQDAYIEVGHADPQADQQADALVVRLHTTLGGIQDVDDLVHGRRFAWVHFGSDDERSGLQLDPARFSRAAIHPSGALKVWHHDTFVSVSVGRPALHAL